MEENFLQWSNVNFSHSYDGMDIMLHKLTPPISTYLSARGCFDIEHGIFIKCTAGKKETIEKAIKEQEAKKGLLSTN